MKNTENALKKEDVIDHDVAISEIQKFVDKWTHEFVEDYQIEDDYPQLLKAIKKGLVKFDDDIIPSYTLAFPLLTDEGNIGLGKVDEFKTRITPNELARITKGLNVAKQQVEYIIRCLCHITSLNRGYINKIDKFDYKVIEQLSTVFF